LYFLFLFYLGYPLGKKVPNKINKQLTKTSSLAVILQPMVKVTGVYKAYNKLQVLQNISLTVEEKKLNCIIGPSGAGKSTLMHIIASLDKADKGNVYYQGQDIQDFSSKQSAQYRNQELGFIFQFHHLLPEFSALENVCIPGWINKQPKAATENKAKELLARLGLQERLTHKPAQLSGGEQQRVAVARALINNPRLILADEPTGNLDSQNATEMHNLFKELAADKGISFLIVTHNQQLANMADKVISLRDGQLAENN
jgi:lipoprotein-releasing system ATP-binding protein